jgi:hypothetical protein
MIKHYAKSQPRPQQLKSRRSSYDAKEVRACSGFKPTHCRRPCSHASHPAAFGVVERAVAGVATLHSLVLIHGIEMEDPADQQLDGSGVRPKLYRRKQPR